MKKIEVKDFVRNHADPNFREFSSYKKLKDSAPFVIRELNYHQFKDDRKEDYIGIIIPNKYMNNATYFLCEDEDDIPFLIIDKREEGHCVLCTMDGTCTREEIVDSGDGEFVLDKKEVILSPPMSKEKDALLSEFKTTKEKEKIIELIGSKHYRTSRLKAGLEWYRMDRDERKDFPIENVQSVFGTNIGDTLSSIRSRDKSAFDKTVQVNQNEIISFKKYKGGNKNMKETVRKFIIDSTGEDKAMLESLKADLDDTVETLALTIEADPDELRDVALEVIEELLQTAGEGGAADGGADQIGDADEDTVLNDDSFVQKQQQILSTVRKSAQQGISEARAKISEYFKEHSLLHFFTNDKNESLSLAVSRPFKKSNGKKIPLDSKLAQEFEAAKAANKEKGKTMFTLPNNKTYRETDIYEREATLKFRIARPSTPFGAVLTVPTAILTANEKDEAAITEIVKNAKPDTVTLAVSLDVLNSILTRNGGEIKEDSRVAVKFFNKNKAVIQGNGIYSLEVVKVDPPKRDEKSEEQYIEAKKRYKPFKTVLKHNIRGTAIITHNNFIPLKRHVKDAISTITKPEELAMYNNAMFGRLFQLGVQEAKRKPVSDYDLLNPEQAKLFKLDENTETVSSDYISAGQRTAIKAEHFSKFTAKGEKEIVEINRIEKREMASGNRSVYVYEELSNGLEKKGYELEDIKIEMNEKMVPVTEICPSITVADIHDAKKSFKEYKDNMKTVTRSTFSGEQVAAIFTNLQDASKYIATVSDSKKIIKVLSAHK